MASCLNTGCTGLGHCRVSAFGTSQRARLAVVCVAAVIAVLTARAHGQNGTSIVLDEVLASWQGDPDVQFVELRLLGDDEQPPPGLSDLELDGPSGADEDRRFVSFTRPLARRVAGARVLVGTIRLRDISGVQPDVVVEPRFIRAEGGRVCYRVFSTFGTIGIIALPRDIDCVAWGKFPRETDPFGAPVRDTPDNRSLERVAFTLDNRTDWRTALEPTPENNAGDVAKLPTLCGNGRIEQGEDCDGERLGGATCVSLGFARGHLRCRDCAYDTRGCTFCGNGRIDDREQCDGADLGGATCADLGFTGGTLRCTRSCRRSTAGCDPTFYLPGGRTGSRDRHECLLEWLVRNERQRPDGSGRARAHQVCRDGDPGCDADAVAGTCTLPVAVCLSRRDVRLPRCKPAAIAAWQLGRPRADTLTARALVASVAALGPSVVSGGTVVFDPPLSPKPRCAAAVAVEIAAGTTLRLRARARHATGGGDDDDVRLECRR